LWSLAPLGASPVSLRSSAETTMVDVAAR
jgi:hypothetical protein